MKTIFICIFSLFGLLINAQSFRDLYKKVDPSVALIQTEEPLRKKNRLVGYEGGIGSGVLISEDGLILTAAHVVQTVTDISVTLCQ